MSRRFAWLLLPLALLMHAPSAHAAGHWIVGGPVAVLASIQRLAEPGAITPAHEPSAPSTPIPVSTAALQPLSMRDHRVKVTVNNGFARTEVTQTWTNPNTQALEARYAVPLPKNASLSEMTIRAGDVVLAGEVRRKAEAERIYEEEKAKGNDAGIAKKDEYRTFEFAVARVLAGATIEVRFVYYQPLTVDTGVVRYVYPMEKIDGAEAGASFWQPNVTGEVPVQLAATVHTSWPVDDVRLPGLESVVKIARRAPGDLTAEATAPAGRDIVIYYRLKSDLPGRIELLPYRNGGDKPGTFMAVLTPGVDLPLIKQGADHLFVLDVSGSMRLRLSTLVDGVSRALDSLTAADRFRLVSFNDHPVNLTPQALPGTPEGIAQGKAILSSLVSDGGTNLYDALRFGLELSQEDRVTNLVLVTDGVANEGTVDPRSFRALLSRADVRLHGFLMGNSANWPLMDTIARASGGHYQAVSNADDIAGLLLLTREKIKSEAIHDVKLDFSGVALSDLTQAPTRVYHGEQLVVFGQYRHPGKGRLEMTATIAGKRHVYATDFELPGTDTAMPELERLHAMALCEELKQLSDAGLMDAAAAKEQIARVAVAGQVVTDETAMVMLTDGQFAARGISRDNQARTTIEHRAQAARASQPAPLYRVDAPRPAYPAPAPNIAAPQHTYPSNGHSGGRRSGGGAFDPLSGALVLALAGLSLLRRPENE